MRIQLLKTFPCLLTLLIACRAEPSRDVARLQTIFDETIKLCAELELGASRSQSTDLAGAERMSEIEGRVAKRSELFWSDEGSEFLTAKQAASTDPVEKACAERLLAAFPG
jgi:hypothetical protein